MLSISKLEAASAASGTGDSLPEYQRNTRRGWRTVIVLALIFIIGSAAAVLAQNIPWYREWHLSRLSLAALEQEGGGRLDDPRLLYHLGRKLNRGGRFTDADPILRNAVGLDPDSPRLRDEWARALLGSGLTTAAFGQLQQFAGTHSNLPAAHLLLGKFYFTQGSMVRAAQQMEKVIALAPGEAEGWSYLAGARNALGEKEAAVQAVQRAIQLQPDSAKDHLLFAGLLALSNQPDDARREFEKVVALSPQQVIAHREYARWLLESGSGDSDFRRAEEEARRAILLDKNDAAAQLVLGRVLQRNNDPKASLLPLTQAATLAPDDPVSALALSQAYRDLNRPDLAMTWNIRYQARQKFAIQRKLLWEKIRVAPEDSVLHRRMARLLGMHGDVAGSVRHYATALHCALDAPQALTAAANDLVDGGHAEKALPLARRAVSIAGSNPNAHEALGNALLGIGQHHLAEIEFIRVVNWLPDRLPAVQKRLDAYYAKRAANPPVGERAFRKARLLERTQVGPRKMTEAVEESVQQAIQSEPVNLDFLFYLLRVQIARKEDSEAIKTARRLLDIYPDHSQTHALLAVLLVEKAQDPASLDAIDQHLKEAGRDAAADPARYYGLGLLALRRGQGDAAARALRQAASLSPQSEVTFYKLALAEKMSGNTEAADQAMKVFRQLQQEKRGEAEALGDIAQAPQDRQRYERAARLFQSHGHAAEAAAIRAEAGRRFSSDNS